MKIEKDARGVRAKLKVARSRRTSEHGFTLVETTFALIIMMVAGLGAASLFAYSINYNSGGNDRAVALAVAQQRMERLSSVPFTDTSLNATASGGVAQNVTSAGRPYSVVTTITDSNIVNGRPTIKTITIQVSPQGAGANWARGTVTTMSQRAAYTVGPYKQ